MGVHVRPARAADMDSMHLLGDAADVERCRADFDRTSTGEVVLLVATGGHGLVGKLHIDLEDEPGTGVIGAVAVVPGRQNQGIGTALMAAAEQALRARGIGAVEVGVEDVNPGARRLYERLGYEVIGRAEYSFQSVDAEGVPVLVHTPGVRMGKALEGQMWRSRPSQ